MNGLRIKPNPIPRKLEPGLSKKEFANIPSHYSKEIRYINLYYSNVSIIIGSKLETSHYPLEWFPKDDPNYIGTKYIDAEMRGSLTAEVIIDTEKENGLARCQ